MTPLLLFGQIDFGLLLRTMLINKFRSSDSGVGEPEFGVLHPLRRVRGLKYGRYFKGDQVPISHEDRYFSCSGVRVSMVTPIDASFNLAISLSITRGTG